MPGIGATDAGAEVVVAAAIAFAPRLPTVVTPVLATEPATLAAWVTALATPGFCASALPAAASILTGSPLASFMASSAGPGSAVPAPLAIGGGFRNSPGVSTSAVMAAS